MTNERLNWLLVGQYEQPKAKRPIEEVRAEVSQRRGSQIGLAPAGEVSVASDSSYHSRGFKL